MTLRLPAVLLSLCLLAQAGVAEEAVTDFPVELLGDLNGMSVPRSKSVTTGGAVKAYGNSQVVVDKWAETEPRVKKRFYNALGDVIEILDKSDFAQLWRDFGYEFYSGEKLERKIGITGFYNAATAPSVNDAFSRIFNICNGPIGDAIDDLTDALSFTSYTKSFKLEVKILGITIVDLDLYVDRGDMLQLRGFLKAATGLLYLMRSYDFAIDYDSAMAALEKFVSDCTDGGMDPLAAFDASVFAHLKIKSISDLQTARTNFKSALDDLAAGDALIKARTDGKDHLLSYSAGSLFDVVQIIMGRRDELITCLDQLISPLNLASAMVPVKPLEMTYTGAPLAPLIGTVTVGGVEVPYEVTGTRSATDAGTYEMTFVGYGRSTGSQTVTWKIVIPPPSLRDDSTAKVQDDGQGGYVIKPSAGRDEIEVTIPLGVDAEKVVIEVLSDVKRVTPNGAKLRIVREVSGQGSVDISGCLDIPAADAQGVVDLANAVVKEEIVNEVLDTAKDAVVQLNAQAPSLTTAKTRPGLVYTVIEGATLGGMTSGDSKVGDGQPWTPKLSVKGGSSGFYTIRVTK